MKYFYYINFSEQEYDPVKKLAEDVHALRKPLCKHFYLRSKEQVAKAFKTLASVYVRNEDAVYITVFKGSKQTLKLVKQLTKQGVFVSALTLVSPAKTFLKTKISNKVNNLAIFEKPEEKHEAQFKVDINFTYLRRTCINDSNLLVNSPSIRTQQIEFVKRLP